MFEQWGRITGEPGGVDYIETDAGGFLTMWTVPTPAKPAVKAVAPKPATPKPTAKQSATAQSNGVLTFFWDDVGYVQAVSAIKDGFAASTRKGNSDLPQFHVHRIFRRRALWYGGAGSSDRLVYRRIC
jgi:hypothetical protein